MPPGYAFLGEMVRKTKLVREPSSLIYLVRTKTLFDRIFRVAKFVTWLENA